MFFDKSLLHEGHVRILVITLCPHPKQNRGQSRPENIEDLCLDLSELV